MSWQLQADGNSLETNNEGELKFAFNFNQWISSNNLTEIKDIFIKHNATTMSTLKYTSKEFKSLMMDQDILQKSYLIPSIMGAIQNLFIQYETLSILFVHN